MDSGLSSGVVALASALKTQTGSERGLTYWATLAKGEPRELAAAKVRGRFERLASLALGLGAVAVELRNGAVVVAVVPVEDDEDDATPVVVQRAEPITSDAEAVRAMVKVVLEAQDVAVKRNAEFMQRVMDSALAVMKTASERTSVLERALLASLSSREKDLAQGFELLAAQGQDLAIERQEAAAAKEESGPADDLAEKLIDGVVMPAMAARFMPKVKTS